MIRRVYLKFSMEMDVEAIMYTGLAEVILAGDKRGRALHARIMWKD
jgi:hypothetical protein